MKIWKPFIKMNEKAIKKQSIYCSHIKIVLTFLCILSSSFKFYGQELDCNALKVGVYYAEISKPIAMKWKVTRNGNQQIEELVELPEEAKGIGYSTNPRYELIEWIDNCTYRLKYDESQFELSDFQKAINENGGALNRIVKIEGDCHYYVSKIVINGRETSMEGRLCSK